MMVYVLSNTLAIFEIQFIIKLSNTEPELKQGVAYTNVLYITVSLPCILCTGSNIIFRVYAVS